MTRAACRSSSSSSNLWWGEAPNQDRLLVQSAFKRLARVTIDAAWPSREFDAQAGYVPLFPFSLNRSVLFARGRNRSSP